MEAVTDQRRCGHPFGMGRRHRRTARRQTAGPTLASARRLGVIEHFETLLADRGYAGGPARECAASFGVTDFDCARRSRQGRVEHTPLGGRWVIERANSWMSNFGQIRRSTDRDPKMRLGQIALAVALILIVKLIDWRDRHQPA